MGIRDYAAGYDPVFEFVKCLSRFSESPFVFGATAWWAGYCTAAFQRRPRVVPRRVIAHIRHEQRQRLRQLFSLMTRLIIRTPVADAAP
jgi:hypothetical protein